VKLKNNYIPRGLIPLEKLFDQKDATLKPILNPSVEEVQDVNLGTTKKPKIIKLSKVLSLEQKKSMLIFVNILLMFFLEL
jgi:hypothetical protein